MNALRDRFDERLAEILAYLDFLDDLDGAIKGGGVGAGLDTLKISVTQQRMLYSGVYLQLYNLVEATITNCLEAVSKVAIASGTWLPGDLSAELRTEWVKHMIRATPETGSQRRLEKAIALCEHLVTALPVSTFEIDKGGGGNWDEDQIKKVVERLGFQLVVPRETFQGVKRVIRDEMGAMALIVSLRNKLAHGSLSFVECGQYDTPAELREIVNRVAAYMVQVVDSFVAYLSAHEFLRPERRPVAA